MSKILGFWPVLSHFFSLSFSCVGVYQWQSEGIEYFICPDCAKATGKTTKFKRKPGRLKQRSDPGAFSNCVSQLKALNASCVGETRCSPPLAK